MSDARFGTTKLAWAAAIALLALVWGWRVLGSPRTHLLVPHHGASWIVADRPFDLRARPPALETVTFRTPFTCATRVGGARLEWRAFERAVVRLDGREIPARETGASWRVASTCEIDVEPGAHELAVIVSHDSAHPALWARCDALGIATDTRWLASTDGAAWTPAVEAGSRREVEQSTFVPTAADAFTRVAPWLGFVALVAATWSVLRARGVATIPRITPSRLRWILVAATSVLALNDLFQVPAGLGMDLGAHLQYVEIVATQQRLPLANEGWQTFQAPLYYVVSAPLFDALRPFVTPQAMVRMLRIVPLACSILQIEVAWRALRTALPRRDDAQCVGLCVAALLPMGLYVSRVVGNEPFAALSSAIVLWRCFALVAPRESSPSRREVAILGLCLALALLSKATALLLVPLCIGVVVRASRGRRAAISNAAIVAAVTLALSGWFYARNWIELGKPFIGGWDPEIGIPWSQDPTYRTPGDFVRFGRALVVPAWANVHGFWDALYSSFTTDATFSSSVVGPPPWNASWMVAGAWLGIPIVAAIVAGAFVRVEDELRAVRALCVIAVAIHLAFLVHLFAIVPVHSTTKATYTLGLLPVYATLAALGSRSLLASRVGRPIAFALLACFACGAYCAYFVV